MFNPTSPVTGGPQNGLTSPTYTLVVDTAPDVNGKQYAVSALGGTQTGVNIHAVSNPFTVTMWRPKTFAVLGKPNPTTNLIANVPKNEYRVIVRKGVTPLAGQPISPALVDCRMAIPAGSDTADQANLSAMLSLAFGILFQQSQGIGDTTKQGIL